MDNKPPQKFAWESDVPEGRFWESLSNENFGRQFLRVFSVDEVAKMELEDKADVEENDKLQLLESLVLRRMTTQPLPGGPETLSSHDFYDKWHRREFLLAHVQRAQGSSAKMAEAEQRYRSMIEIWAKRDDPDKKWPQDLGSIDNLLILLAQQDRFAEAEPVAENLIQLIRQCQDLGHASPMNIGIMLKLMDMFGKQGKFDGALALLPECHEAITQMADSKYAKYTDMQTKQLDEMKSALAQRSSWASGYLIIR